MQGGCSGAKDLVQAGKGNRYLVTSYNFLKVIINTLVFIYMVFPRNYAL